MMPAIIVLASRFSPTLIVQVHHHEFDFAFPSFPFVRMLTMARLPKTIERRDATMLTIAKVVRTPDTEGHGCSAGSVETIVHDQGR